MTAQNAQPRRLCYMRMLLFALVACLTAQERPSFDVVSVKPHPADVREVSFPHFLPGGRFETAGLPVWFTIAAAYNVGFQSPRLTGGPKWISGPEGVFDIEAKASPDSLPAGLASNVRAERLRQMLQAMLADRFHLKIHRETKEMPAYELTVARSGLKLDRSKIDEKDCAEGGPKADACHAIRGGRGRGLHSEAATIDDIVNYVENWSDHPILNKTGIRGLFNVQTSGWQNMQPGPVPPAGAKAEDGTNMADLPTLFNIFERLGLKLQAVSKAKVEIYVIDSIDKPVLN